MSIGKHTSLKEARDKKALERFIKEHPSQADKKAFESLLDRMTKIPVPPRKKPKGGGTSTQA